MLRALGTGLCVAALHCGTAAAAEMIESTFQTTFTYGGSEHWREDHIVPLLPNNACFTWGVRLAEGEKPATVTERLELPVPVPVADWGDTGADPDIHIEIREGGKVAITTFTPEFDARGWLSHGWCLSENDSVGRHRIDVSLDGTPLTSYEFEVVRPEDYAWPAIPQPDPDARSSDRSW